jgi:hypothetical protein
LKARVDAEEYKLFLVKEAEREKMLAEEAKEQLAKKSEEADRARMAKAEKDWQELQERESAEGVPVGAPAFSYRSKQADLSREAFESVGNLRDRWNGAALEKGHWFDSDLCILEQVNSMQMVIFEQLKMTGLLCSRYSATAQKGRRFFTLAGKDMELPNGKGSKRKAASKRQRAASPEAPALDGGSPVEGEMAEEPLAVPGPSGVSVGASGSVPPVPAEESAAAAEPTAAGLAAAGPPPASPVMEPAMVQPAASAVEYMAAVEPMGVGLSVPATQAAATAPAAEAVMTVRLVSEALSGLALELAAAKKPAARVPARKPAAMEPAVATAEVLATTSTAAGRARPVLADGPVAASKECWILNPGVVSKVIVKMLSIGPAAAEAAATEGKCAREPMPGPGWPPVARRAAAETESPPVVTAPEPAAPTAAAAPVKRKAKAGVTGGSQKRKKSSPAEAKDL